MKRMKLTTAGRVVIFVIVLALLAGIGGFGYNYYKNNIADDKPISSGTQSGSTSQKPTTKPSAGKTDTSDPVINLSLDEWVGWKPIIDANQGLTTQPGSIFDQLGIKVNINIINDATDPFGHTEGLFTKEFYGSCYKALKEDGIMVYQHGSPFYDEDKEECMKMHRKAFRAFPVSRVYQAHIPTCSSGYWLFGFASKKYHPLNNLRVKEWKKLHIKTRYYTTNLHRGAFMLPKYLEDMLEDEEDR
jgi:hypothetical protein